MEEVGAAGRCVKYHSLEPDPGAPTPGSMRKMAESPTSSTTYRDAGVDIDAGDALVDRIKPT